MGRSRKYIRIAGALYLVALLFFAWGALAGNLKIFPWPYIQEAIDYFTFKDGPPKTLPQKIVLDHQESPSELEAGGLVIKDPAFQDQGYLLLSRYSKQHQQVIVELLSLAQGKVLHTWAPPLEDIFKRSPEFNKGANTRESYRAQNPLLLEDGSLVFNSGDGPLARIDKCGQVVWVISRQFHHSVERDHQGNLVAPIVCKPPVPGGLPLRDDGFAVVSPKGKILAEYSVTELLLKNGYRGLFYGVGNYGYDRIHLNDAQPLHRDMAGGKRGDVALSCRHLSTVLLVDPDSGKVRWLKTGPWLNQHDVNRLADGRFSIFGNDVIRQDGKCDAFAQDGMSNIYVYDPLTGRVATPYAALMRREKLGTPTQGRSKILPNGDVFMELSDYGRLLRISPQKTRWEYVNKVSPNTIGAVHWSRYIPNDQIDLTWLQNLPCK